MPWTTVQKPAIPLGGEAEMKAGVIEALRAAWTIERDWRRRLREVTPTTHGCWSSDLLAAVWWGVRVRSLTEALASVRLVADGRARAPHPHPRRDFSATDDPLCKVGGSVAHKRWIASVEKPKCHRHRKYFCERLHVPKRESRPK